MQKFEPEDRYFYPGVICLLLASIFAASNFTIRWVLAGLLMLIAIICAVKCIQIVKKETRSEK